MSNKNLERGREYSRKYRREHPEKIKTYQKKYSQEHKEEARAWKRRDYQEHREERAAYARQWQRKHMLCTGGRKIQVLKRDYPEDNCCELCGKKVKSHLQYHHWDSIDLSLGMWICLGCHSFAHYIENNYLLKYIELKEEIENAEW